MARRRGAQNCEMRGIRKRPPNLLSLNLIEIKGFKANLLMLCDNCGVAKPKILKASNLKEIQKLDQC